MKHPQSPIPTPAITEELLQELRRLEAEATPGPWRAAQGPVPPDTEDAEWWTIAELLVDGGNKASWYVQGDANEVDAHGVAKNDAALIVTLRNAAPGLLAAAARLKETEALLSCVEKYAREDRAVTPGFTRLERVLAEIRAALTPPPKDKL